MTLTSGKITSCLEKCNQYSALDTADACRLRGCQFLEHPCQTSLLIRQLIVPTTPILENIPVLSCVSGCITFIVRDHTFRSR